MPANFVGKTTTLVSKDNKTIGEPYTKLYQNGHLLDDLDKLKAKRIMERIDYLTDDLSFNDGIRFKGLNETGAYVNEMYLNNVLVKKAKSGSKITLILKIIIYGNSKNKTNFG